MTEQRFWKPQPGDKVQFNVAFENADTRIDVDEEGEVHRGLGALGYLSIIARGQIWLAKAYEVRPAGTKMSLEQAEQIRQSRALVEDFIGWMEARRQW
jgi:hypothetical protein